MNNNAVLRRYTWSPVGLDTPVSVYDAAANATYYYHTDANKNITELTDATGAVAAHYEYSPFGKVLVANGTYASINPFRFSSEYHDDESGLVYYNYRYYSPELGRWLSKDPIGERGGWNLYAMVANGISNHTDMNGNGPFGYAFAWIRCTWEIRKWQKKCMESLPDCSDPCLDAFEMAECFQRRNEAIENCALNSEKMLKVCIAAGGKF